MSPRDRAVRLLMLYNCAVETENSTLAYEPRRRGLWTRWCISWRWATLSVATALAVTIFYYHKQLYDRLFYAYWQRQCEKYVMPEALPLSLTSDHPRFAELGQHPDYLARPTDSAKAPTLIFKPNAWRKLERSYRGWLPAGPTLFLGSLTTKDSSSWILHVAPSGLNEGSGAIRGLDEYGIQVTAARHTTLFAKPNLQSTMFAIPEPDLSTLSFAQRDPSNPAAIILKYTSRVPSSTSGKRPLDVVLKLKITAFGGFAYNLTKTTKRRSDNPNSLTPSTSPSAQPSPR
jgi:hypothetical protein